MNRIHVSLSFSFKGETHAPQADVDLDALAGQDQAPDWHALLAHAASIDTYSYAYEVMQQSRPAFSAATGLAADHLHDGEFDFDAFRLAYRQAKVMAQLQEIATSTLGIRDLAAKPALGKALLQAYELGRNKSAP